MVLALVLPVMAGLGLNFGLVLGAMGMIGIQCNHKIVGSGFLLCLLLSTPFAILFGLMTRP